MWGIIVTCIMESESTAKEQANQAWNPRMLKEKHLDPVAKKP